MGISFSNCILNPEHARVCVHAYGLFLWACLLACMYASGLFDLSRIKLSLGELACASKPLSVFSGMLCGGHMLCGGQKLWGN